MNQPGITSTIIKAKTLEQSSNNMRSINLELTPEDLKRLNEASALDFEYPG
jgi:aryl-alcohol dehydrogenase-like predicted oxidoreductase